MHMTVPQILILNHAAWVNSKRSDERMERKRKKDEDDREAQRIRDEEDPIVWKGKRFSELTADELNSYYSGIG